MSVVFGFLFLPQISTGKLQPLPDLRLIDVSFVRHCSNLFQVLLGLCIVPKLIANHPEFAKGAIFKIVRQAEAECLREFFCRQNVIVGEGNQPVATKPDESLSPSLFTFRSHFAAIHHYQYYEFMTARGCADYLWRAFSFSSACFNSSSFCPASPSLPSAVRRW